MRVPGYHWVRMATIKRDRMRVALTLTGVEAVAVARAAEGAGLKPATWARAAVLKAAERSEAVVVARAERLLKELAAGLPGGKAHSAGVAKHRREGWDRGRR